MYWYIFSSVIMGLGGIALYVHYLRRGQFEDPEDVKYQMFRQENDE